MLSLLLGFSVALNLTILKRFWVTSIQLGLLVKLLDTQDTLEQESVEQVLALIPMRGSIRYLFRLQKLLRKEHLKSSTQNSLKSSKCSTLKSKNVSSEIEFL